MSKHNRKKHIPGKPVKPSTPPSINILSGLELLFNTLASITPLPSPSLYFDARMVETVQDYVVYVQLSGFDRDDVTVEYLGNVLRVSACKKSQNTYPHNYGMGYGFMSQSYSRSFVVNNISVDNIQSSYSNGILTLKLPKISQINPNQSNNVRRV